MQTYPTFCTLTKDWVSHNGRLYHSGTTFKKSTEDYPGNHGHWYEFKAPLNLPLPYAAGSFGFVFIPNVVFLKLTEKEKQLRESREKQRKEHFKRCKPIF